MLCDKKHSHVQWRDFKMNVLVCDDDQQIVDSIIEELKKKSEETHVALRFYGFSQPSQINSCSTFAADSVLSISMCIICNACDSALRYKRS